MCYNNIYTAIIYALPTVCASSHTKHSCNCCCFYLRLPILYPAQSTLTHIHRVSIMHTHLCAFTFSTYTHALTPIHMARVRCGLHLASLGHLNCRHLLHRRRSRLSFQYLRAAQYARCVCFDSRRVSYLPPAH